MVRTVMPVGQNLLIGVLFVEHPNVAQDAVQRQTHDSTNKIRFKNGLRNRSRDDHYRGCGVLVFWLGGCDGY